MNSGERKRLLEFSKELAIGAGEILRRGLNHSLKVKFKGRINPVTDLDIKSEKFIADRIARRYPDHEILGEEGTDSESPSRYRWIIDPIDGTVNFTHAFPVYAVSVGLELDGRPQLGAVYDPDRDELFWAARGMGAWLNRQRISVTSESRLERALLATGFAYDIGTARRNNLGLFSRMAKRAQGIRRLGSAALDLCWLAAGRLDGFWELKLHPWDTAAAVVIVEEAGGKVTRIDGRQYSVFDKDVLASNGKIHSAMSRVLAGRVRSPVAL